MTVYSMTGFAQKSGHNETLDWIWEAKSVNGRGLDVRCRLGHGFDSMEHNIRKSVASHFKRGNISISLRVNQNIDSNKIYINKELLQNILKVVEQYRNIEGLQKPSLDGLLGLRGVIVPAEPFPDSLEVMDSSLSELNDGLIYVLEALKESREQEGLSIAKVLIKQLERMEKLVDRACKTEALRPNKIKKRVRDQLNTILETGADVSEERLAVELAIIATKTDVREELDRLDAHINAALGLLSKGGTIGRKLEFLSQEINRETNTLCAKANDLKLGEVGLALKVVIDQFREQVQNLE